MPTRPESTIHTQYRSSSRVTPSMLVMRLRLYCNGTGGCIDRRQSEEAAAITIHGERGSSKKPRCPGRCSGYDMPDGRSSECTVAFTCAIQLTPLWSLSI